MRALAIFQAVAARELFARTLGTCPEGFNVCSRVFHPQVVEDRETGEFVVDSRDGEPATAPNGEVDLLVERFDIEPYSDFSSK